jgi:uncharacterized protein YecE (DUF72 family)
MTGHGQVRIGTSGWIYQHWRRAFYPADLPVKRWFAFYSESFDTVEINNTFYRLPPPTVFKAWAAQAPPGFLYAVKASRFLTHMKKLKDATGPLDNILGRARLLGDHLGPVLYQLPPHWHRDTDRLRQFLELLPVGLEHVFEFRDPSWYTDEVCRLLDEHGVGFCIHDLRGASSPRWVTGPLAYVRFHGPTQTAYAGFYPRRHLEGWAEQIVEFQSAGRDVHVYFNNDQRGYAVANARELRTLLGMGFVAGRE